MWTVEILEIEERKNNHINELMKKHEKVLSSCFVIVSVILTHRTRHVPRLLAKSKIITTISHITTLTSSDL